LVAELRRNRSEGIFLISGVMLLASPKEHTCIQMPSGKKGLLFFSQNLAGTDSLYLGFNLEIVHKKGRAKTQARAITVKYKKKKKRYNQFSSFSLSI